MKKIGIIFSIFLCSFFAKADHRARHVNKVVIWAYKLHSHSHSYIHWGYNRAYKFLGYDTYWFDDRDNVENFDFSNSLFITMGATANHKMPMRDDCYYIIHNGNSAKYQYLVKQNRCIFLQVYTIDCVGRDKWSGSPCCYHNLADACIYMPWATDLFPHEIDMIKENLPSIIKNRTISFVGSVYSENVRVIDHFRKAALQKGYVFSKGAFGISMDNNIKLIQEAYMAPAIQSEWQCAKEYIPCRIFKNISYGAMGITNSKAVCELFNKKIIYNSDTKQLFLDAQKAMENYTLDDQYELMDFVRDNHTYLNRIESMFQFFEKREDYLNNK